MTTWRARALVFGGLAVALALLALLDGGRIHRSSAQAVAGVPVTYSAGWNLVGGPQGTVLGADAVFTLGPNDAAYRNLAGTAPIEASTGYWAYFSSDTTVTLNGVGRVVSELQAPSGRYFIIGNPDGVQPVRVSGLDSLLTYDPASGSYSAVSTLAVGQGAWAFSYAGGTVTLTGIGTPLPFGNGAALSTPTPTPSPAPTAVSGGVPLTLALDVDPAQTTVSANSPGVLAVNVDVMNSGQPAPGATITGGISFYSISTGGRPDVPIGPDPLGNYTGETLELSLPALPPGTPVFIHVEASLNGLTASADTTYFIR